MKLRARSRAVFVVAVATLAAWGGGSASAGMPDESRVLANLLHLRGETVSMLYSPGALDRAAHLQQRLEAVAKDVYRWSGIDLGLQVIVLAPEDWRALHLGAPYGMPQPMPGGLASPAWGDQDSVALWHRLLGQDLPWSGGEPLRGSRDEAASVALADTLLQVECGRLAADRAVAVSGPEWIRELLAHVVALSALAMHEEGRAGEIYSTYAALAAHLPPPGRITAFSRGADLETRLAYQQVFYHGAEIVLAKDGRKAAKTLLRLPKKDGQLTEGDLVKRYPELRAWLAGGGADASAAR